MPEQLDEIHTLVGSMEELPGPDAETVSAEDVKKRNAKFRQQVELCKQYRRKLIRDWQTNVDYRRGKPFMSQSDADRVAAPLDWTLTNNKQAALFSQVPAVRINHAPQTVSEEVSTWLHPFEQRLNNEIVSAGIESVMDECLPDCINAAGIGAAIVAREAITEMVDVPAVNLDFYPPEQAQQIMESGMMPDGTPVQMKQVPREIDSRYTVTRISPSDLLWPVGFGSSDFDKAPWLGRSGRVSWTVAQQRFGLKDADKTKVIGEEKNTLDRIDRLDYEAERDAAEHEDAVSFDEIFYKEFEYTAGVKKFARIHHLVFVHGKQEPVIDKPWEGQQEDEQTGDILGALQYPVRVLVLSYVTDDAIPPSDSAIGRPMVDEINKSRSQMIQQRQYSIPVRTFDVNRVDPTVQFTLMRGDWQGMIPVQGNGQSIIAEIARSGFPQENFAFDKVAKTDLAESWGRVPGITIDAQADANPALGPGPSTRLARERAKVASFFVGIAQVMGGLISIFEDPMSFGEGFSPQVSKTLAYSILADSTVILDANQRLKRLMDFVNFTAKSGYVKLEPVLREAATLSGLDPNLVIEAPQPRPPAEPNISLRLTGTEDLLMPMTLAFLMKSGQAPDAQLIEQAKQLINVAVSPPPPPPMLGPDGQPLPPGMEGQPPDAGMPPGPPGSPVAPPSPPPLGVGEAHPQWSAMNRINSRVLERDEEGNVQ